MSWPVVTLISGRRCVSRQDNKELQSGRAVPYMVMTYVTVLARSHLLANAGFWGPKCVVFFFGASLGKLYVGLGFLGLLAVGRLRWWEDESLLAGIFWCLVGFLEHFALGEASWWDDGVSSMYGFASRLSILIHSGHGSLSRMSCEPSSCWRQLGRWMEPLT